jgi:MFS family permease
VTGPIKQRLGRTFSAFAVPNFRRYFFGQATSVAGTWMQITAQAWLVLTLTNSATDLGIALSLQTLPILLFGTYGGLIADRVDRRRLMMWLESSMALQALVLGVLTISGVIRFWEVCVLASILGLHSAFESPARQSFVREVAGREHLQNAISWAAIAQNTGRIIGPAIGGLLITYFGTGECFLVNGVSFGVAVYALFTLDMSTLRSAESTDRAKGQLREGFQYVRKTPNLAIPLAMMAVVGTFALEFQVTIPSLVKTTFHQGAAGYGYINAAQGVGAIVGGLVVATRGKAGLRSMIVWLVAFGVALGLLALAPNMVTAYLIMAVMGWSLTTLATTGQTTIQLASDPQMRGRTLSLWIIATQGTTPLGASIIGVLIQSTNPRVGIGFGAIACLVAAGGGVVLARHSKAWREGPATIRVHKVAVPDDSDVA